MARGEWSEWWVPALAAAQGIEGGVEVAVGAVGVDETQHVGVLVLVVDLLLGQLAALDHSCGAVATGNEAECLRPRSRAEPGGGDTGEAGRSQEAASLRACASCSNT